MKKIFNDFIYDSFFRENGYIIIEKFLSDELIQKLEEIYNNNPIGIEKSFYTSQWSKDKNVKRVINLEVKNLIDFHFLKLFNNYKNIYSYFMTKRVNDKSFSHAHQDWTIVDEVDNFGVNIWGPFCNTSEHNGTMCIFPKSHIRYNNFRGSDINLPYDSFEIKNTEDFMSLDLNKGDVLFFDHRLIHFTPNNVSNQDRVALGSVFIPQHADIVHYFNNKNGLSKKNLKEDFLIEFSFGESIENYFIEVGI